MSKKILITGGAGFIGVNTALYYLKKGEEVSILDNFSRKGSLANIKWLQKNNRGKLKIIKAEIRYDQKKINEVVKDKDIIFHLAAQVAVTSSVVNPREDFEINALGTFNVLEAIRKFGNNPILVYSSTNKVYGGLEDLKMIERKTRYLFKDLPLGISENRATDFHSPYGCSKGTADQYVRDYARIYDLNTIVFRQSCIYGPHQFGVEDQGWVAWFIIALTLGRNITIYGNGKQVRDLLFVEDLIKAYDLAAKNIKKTKGQIYNIGGGARNAISVWFDFKPVLERLFGRKIEPKFLDWRPGDQPIYISDIRKAKRDFGWEPKVGVEEGIKKLFDWVSANKSLLRKI
jgi:CDP-paratose 2-epimerase